jgi:hypothetical protein
MPLFEVSINRMNLVLVAIVRTMDAKIGKQQDEAL